MIGTSLSPNSPFRSFLLYTTNYINNYEKYYLHRLITNLNNDTSMKE